MSRILVLLILGFLSLGILASEVFPTLPNTQGNIKSRIGFYLEEELLVGDSELGNVYLNLASVLKAEGHEITILYNTPLPSTYLRAGLKFQMVPQVNIQHNEVSPPQVWKSYELYEYLKTQQFDVVHVPDWKGTAYYSVLAKKEGLAFPHTIFVVGLQAPFIWSKLNNFERVQGTATMEIDFMQRRTIELADIVVSPTQYMLSSLKGNGWVFPNQTYVQQNLIASRFRSQHTTAVRPASEIVFYGDLKPSEGLILFCDALDRIYMESKEVVPEKLRITFLGNTHDVQGINANDYIYLRKRRWSGATLSIISNKDSFESLRYLTSASRLAVVAPENANAPLRVQELMQAGASFIASAVGGIPEMIAPQSRNILFAPRADKLATKILESLRSGLAAARPAQSQEEVKSRWINFHSTLRASGQVSQLTETPLVSVCIIHFNRPEYLRQAIASIEQQDYPSIEVVLVDDASSSVEAREEVSNLETLFAERGWKVVVLPDSSYLGKARNIAVQHATGKYVLFLDDDNVAKPKEVSTFVTAAENTGADVLTSVQDDFRGDEAPGANELPYQRRVPLGADVATGFFWNCFGDANSFVKRESFLRIGGFTEDYGVGYEDYEFFASAILKGLKLEVVPEPLFWYRRSYVSMSFSTPLYKNRMRYIRPYVENLPSSLSNLFLYAQALHYNDLETPFLGKMYDDGNCSMAMNCSNCTAMSNCGWCEFNRTCLSGDVNGAMGGSCPAGWAFNTSSCAACDGLTKCDKCAEVAGCGWCESSGACYNGNSTYGAYYVSANCHGSPTKFDTTTKQCPSSGSDKKKIAIIVGFSVAGGLIVIAAIATGLFCVWHRQRGKRGYEPINQG